MTVQTYDALAEVYAERAVAHGASTQPVLTRVFLPRLHPMSRVLDVGCATGVGTELIADAGHDVRGIDQSPEMIRIARQRRGNARFYVEDWTRSNYRGLDAMMAFAFFHLFPKREVPDLLTHAWRQLRPGGLLYCGTTVEAESREGMERKADYPDAPERFRARWTPDEVLRVWPVGWEIVDISTHETNVAARKLWLDLLLRRPA